MSLPMRRCYVPLANASAVTPEARALLVCDPIPLADGSVLLKVRRALVSLSADETGALVRELPAAVASLPGIGAPMGSEAASRLIAETEAWTQTIAALKLAASERLGVEIKASLKADVVAAYVDAKCGPAKVEIAPDAVIAATQPWLWEAIAVEREAEPGIDTRAALVAVAEAKVVDGGKALDFEAMP